MDTEAGIIIDVEATPVLRSQEVQTTKVMIERVKDRFGLETKKVIGDTAYGTAEFLGWVVNEKGIEPHVPVENEKSGNAGSNSSHRQNRDYNDGYSNEFFNRIGPMRPFVTDDFLRPG